MANEVYRTEYKNTTDTSSFSGIIYPLDFEPDCYNGRNIASRITSDWKFDERCKKNEEIRDRKELVDEKETKISKNG